MSNTPPPAADLGDQLSAAVMSLLREKLTEYMTYRAAQRPRLQPPTLTTDRTKVGNFLHWLETGTTARAGRPTSNLAALIAEFSQ